MRSSMNISLPAGMRAWVEAQVAKGEYGSVSEFVRELVREAKKRQVREEIDAKLVEALESGEAIEVTPEYWERKRRELEKRMRESSQTS